MRFFKKIKSDSGNYVDKNGLRYFIEWCNSIYSSNKNPEDLNYFSFETLDDAISFWELTTYVDPELEKYINEQNLITEND